MNNFKPFKAWADQFHDIQLEILRKTKGDWLEHAVPDEDITLMDSTPEEDTEDAVDGKVIVKGQELPISLRVRSTKWMEYDDFALRAKRYNSYTGRWSDDTEVKKLLAGKSKVYLYSWGEIGFIPRYNIVNLLNDYVHNTLVDVLKGYIPLQNGSDGGTQFTCGKRFKFPLLNDKGAILSSNYLSKPKKLSDML